MEEQRKHTFRHIGSTLALAFGVFLLLSSFKRDSPSGIIPGVPVILGALAYRSAKKRKLGEVRNTGRIPG